MQQRLARDSETPDRYGGGGKPDKNKRGSMVGVPARGKAVTTGRDKVVERSRVPVSRRGGGIKGSDTVEL